MRRFYASADQITDRAVNFDKEESAHIHRVLRLTPGEKILVSDGTGTDRLCELTAVEPLCTAEIRETFPNENEPTRELVLFQSVIKNEKMDLVIQKAAEIGVSRIVPVMTERTVVKLEDENKEIKKQERWQKTALEACKQCGRSRVPTVERAVRFGQVPALMARYELRVVAYEEETMKNLREVVSGQASAAYFIGPEGGITPEEHQALVKAGAVSVSLGKRILRAETAAVVCGAVILAYSGELDG